MGVDWYIWNFKYKSNISSRRKWGVEGGTKEIMAENTEFKASDSQLALKKEDKPKKPHSYIRWSQTFLKGNS